MIIAVSAALKTVMVAKPSGLAVAESVIFPFNIPCGHDIMQKNKKDTVSSRVFFMLLVMAIQKTNLYDIVRIRRMEAGLLIQFCINGQ